MINIPNIGTDDELTHNEGVVSPAGQRGLIGFFTDHQNVEADRPIVTVNGSNGGVDIGGGTQAIPGSGVTDELHGVLILRDKDKVIQYIIKGETGDVLQKGDICLVDDAGNERLCISGKTADLVIKSPAGDVVVHLDGKTGNLMVGGGGQDGDVIVNNSAGNETIRLDGNTGNFTAGGNGQDGDVIVKNSVGAQTIHLDGNTGNVIAGGNGQDGDVTVRNSAGAETIRLDGNTGDVTAGGNGQDGDVIVRNSAGAETIRLDGNSGDITAGGNGQDGDVIVRNSAGNQTIRLDGNTGNIFAGGNGQDGDLFVRNSAGNTTVNVNGDAANVRLGSGGGTITLDGNNGDITLGGNGQDGALSVQDAAGNERILVDGATGDIRLSGADCAEDFDIIEADMVEPGTVMIFEQDGKLRQSLEAYDKKVAGVIAGAGQYRPGIILDQQHDSTSTRMPVALMGKVYCKVDANYAPVKAGDLLTTSPTPGHAMKANDPLKAFGAVVGKALHPLNAGKELIPILVALQ